MAEKGATAQAGHEATGEGEESLPVMKTGFLKPWEGEIPVLPGVCPPEDLIWQLLARRRLLPDPMLPSQLPRAQAQPSH